jgi:hypothetical protein
MDIFSFWLGYVVGSVVGSVSTGINPLPASASPEQQQPARRHRRVFWLVVSFSTLTVLVAFLLWAFFTLR